MYNKTNGFRINKQHKFEKRLKEGIIVHFTQREQDKLMLVVANDLARRRQSRGLKLNYPEAVAIISYEMLEGVPETVKVSQNL